MKAPLVLIDASSYFFRAFHALPPLKTSQGQATGAIYGVANMIKKLVKDYKPAEVAVVFDAKGKTFRNDWYPDYKAHRPSMPDELRSQFQPLIELLDAMGLPLLIIEGVEADDVIGTLARLASAQSIPVVISTSDKDLAQLVNEHVTLINTMSNYTMDIAGVKSKFGVLPAQMVDYLTLVGDSSDNIPGVTKCGPKTAVKWLEEHETLDNLMVNAQKIGGKIGECLRASIPHLPLSKKLVTIKTDVDLPCTLEGLTLKPVKQERLVELIRTFEFKLWLKEVLEQAQPKSSEESLESSSHPEIITTLQQLNHALEKLAQCTMVCIHLETMSPDVMVNELIGISLAFDETQALYIPLGHTETTTQLDKTAVLTALKPLLENPAIKKISKNSKFVYCILKSHDIHLKGIAYDIMLESYIINSGASRHDLDNLSLKYLGHKSYTLEDVSGKGARQLPFNQLPVHKAAIYATEQAKLAMQLHQKLLPLIEVSLHKVFHEVEMPLVTVLADMERLGVLIDSPTLQAHGLRLKQRINELEQEALALAGKPFNLNSPKQLQEILFEEQKLPIIAKTPKGQASTSEPVLAELALDYRIAAVILEYRGLTKLVSTYIDALPKKINVQTQRVHTSYNQAIAATGRLSSSEPNLQNIPIRNEEGRLIRTAFIPPPGHVILAADYSQIELRIMAHLSQDETLLTAFANDWDIHTATASEIFQTPLTEVSHEQRRRAKAVNFGLIYGMSAFGLAKQIGVERQIAQDYIDMYFKRYPKVLEYMERTRKQAHALGYVETLFGRRLYLPEINTKNIMRRKAAERTAINAPMQGTAADIIKKAMIQIAQWQQSQPNPPAKMIMQVHDELVFEVREEAIDQCKTKICDIMEQVVTLSVPLRVSVGVGLNWDAAH
ncbi:MAG: DNA polymerase I [Legionella sp.]|nr:DNA polymerase I [Legionella sp.]